MPTSYCLIPHPRECKILTVRAEDGGWTLPTVEHDDRWFTEVAGEVAREVAARFGMALTALREIEHDGVRVCEMENHSPDGAPDNATWVDRETIADIPGLDAALRAILLAWFDEWESGVIPELRPPWERRGWYAEAEQWIRSTAASLGYIEAGPVEQFKCAWSWSSILRLPTDGGFPVGLRTLRRGVGLLWFKADYAKPPPEPAIIAELARRWPAHVPRLVAVDHERRWMLTEDFGTERLSTRPVARWQSAVKRFGEIQAACAADIGRWRDLGCPDRGIPLLKTLTSTILDDVDALRIDQPSGLTSDELSRLNALRPRLGELWDELASIGIPDSIVQLDFREGNMAIANRSPLFYDWSDTVIAPPFFSACRCLDYIWSTPKDSPRKLSGNERRRRIRNAYLEAWAGYASPSDLLHAFRLARQLNPMFLAIRWYLEIPHCEPDSPWGRAMRDGPAHSLKRCLESMERLKDEGEWRMDACEGAEY